MKILHIDQHYKYSGGTEQYYLEIMDMLEKAGHRVAMAYGIRDEHTLELSHRPEYHIPGIEAIPGTVPIKRALDALAEVVNKERPDVIHIHNLRNFRIIRMLSAMKPTVRFVHDPSLCCFRDWKLLPRSDELCTYPVGWRCLFTGCLKDYPLRPARALLLKRSEIRVHKNISHMLVASRYMKDLLAFNGIPESKISVLPLFTRLPPMEDIESDSSENIVLFVGLIHPVKGADKLIKALALVKSEFRAHLIGEGPNLEQYRRLAADEGIGDRINFARWVEHDKISQYYAEASVVAVPSWWTEAFGIVGIEAMAHATPVVAFETGGISDWLDDGVTGFLVQRGDIDTLAAKIDALLSDKALASEMGQNAREAAEKKFNREDYLPKLIGVYERVLSSWKSS